MTLAELKLFVLQVIGLALVLGAMTELALVIQIPAAVKRRLLIHFVSVATIVMLEMCMLLWERIP